VTRMVADEEYVFVCQGTSSREAIMLALAESSCEVATSMVEIVGVAVGDKGACSELQLSPVAGPLPGYFGLDDMKAEKRMEGCQIPYLWLGVSYRRMVLHSAPFMFIRLVLRSRIPSPSSHPSRGFAVDTTPVLYHSTISFLRRALHPTTTLPSLSVSLLFLL
jgi:hypothetical protein